MSGAPVFENSPAIHDWVVGVAAKSSSGRDERTVLPSLSGLVSSGAANRALKGWAIFKAGPPVPLPNPREMAMFRLGMAMFRLGMAMFRLGMAMFRPGMAMFRLGMAMFRLEMAMFRLEMAMFRLGMAMEKDGMALFRDRMCWVFAEPTSRWRRLQANDGCNIKLSFLIQAV